MTSSVNFKSSRPLRRRDQDYTAVVEAAQRGEEWAITRMLQAVTPAIARMANTCRNTNSENEVEDYIQEALMRVASRGVPEYDMSREIEWLTFATWHARAAMWRLRSLGRIICNKTSLRCLDTRERYMKTHNIDINQFWALQTYVPIDDGLSPNNTKTHMDVMTSDSHVELIHDIEMAQAKALLLQTAATMSPRDQDILTMFIDGKGCTEIGRTVSLTRQGVSLIIHSAIRKTKASLDSTTAVPLNVPLITIVWGILVIQPASVRSIVYQLDYKVPLRKVYRIIKCLQAQGKVRKVEGSHMWAAVPNV